RRSKPTGAKLPEPSARLWTRRPNRIKTCSTGCCIAWPGYRRKRPPGSSGDLNGCCKPRDGTPRRTQTQGVQPLGLWGALPEQTALYEKAQAQGLHPLGKQESAAPPQGVQPLGLPSRSANTTLKRRAFTK